MNQNGWVPSLERASWTAPHFTLRQIPPSGDGGYGLRPPSGDGGYFNSGGYEKAKHLSKRNGASRPVLHAEKQVLNRR